MRLSLVSESHLTDATEAFLEEAFESGDPSFITHALGIVAPASQSSQRSPSTRRISARLPVTAVRPRLRASTTSDGAGSGLARGGGWVISRAAAPESGAQAWEPSTMADARVTCITKQPRKNPHEGITHLGGNGWKRSKAEVIAAIEDRRDTFHLLVGGERAEISVLNGPNGKYLRAYAQGQWNDSLLTLPPCI